MKASRMRDEAGKKALELSAEVLLNIVISLNDPFTFPTLEGTETLLREALIVSHPLGSQGCRCSCSCTCYAFVAVTVPILLLLSAAFK